jgi:tetratricopeptide (TPR) repeat protein
LIIRIQKIIPGLFLLLNFILGSAEMKGQTDSLENLLKTLPEKEHFSVYIQLVEQCPEHNREKCMSYAEKALSLSKKYKNQVQEAHALNELGVLHYKQGNLLLAIDYYSQALELDRKYGTNSDVAIRLSNLGMAYCYLGNYLHSIELLTEAFGIDSKNGDSTKMAVRLNNLGIVHTYLKDFEKALDYFSQAYQIDSLAGNDDNISARLGNIGVICLRMNKPEKALVYLKRALVIDEKNEDQGNIAIRYSGMGRAMLAMNKFDEAEDYFLKAIELDTKVGAWAGVASDYLNLGQVKLKCEKPDQALDFLTRCMSIADSLELMDLRIEAYLGLSDAWKQKGSYEKAFRYLSLYTNLKDSVFSRENQKKLSDLQNRFFVETKEKEIELLEKEKKMQSLIVQQKEDELYKQSITRYGLIGLLIFTVSVFVALYLYRRNRETKARQRLEKELHLYMQKALSQQMNPHFIFNTLNSIQYYLLNNDKLTSNKYLSKFARLMRITLNNSQQNTILLSQELEALQLYIELEELRFENKFTSILTVSDEVKAESLQVYPFILQPFVENAIWHGLVQKEGPGNLMISVRKSDSLIIVSVEDNGIGREKARQIMKEKKPGHKSCGIQITESRIGLINDLYKSSMRLQTLDLTDNEGNPTGTRVVVEFPIIPAHDKNSAH